MQKGMESKKNTAHRIMSVIGIVLCVVFGFLLACNLTIIVKGSLNPDRPPSIFGVTPMVVLTDSMSGTAKDHIESGDLIFVEKADPDKLEVGDVISFFEEGTRTVVTHRIVEKKYSEDGSPFFITKGDANNIADDQPVTVDRIIGVYVSRVPGVGHFALFLQTPTGMLVFIGIPLLAFIIYDILRRQHYANKEKASKDALEEELIRLRAMAEKQNEASAQTDAEPNNEPADDTHKEDN